MDALVGERMRCRMQGLGCAEEYRIASEIVELGEVVFQFDVKEF
jgi:hypothetical protein